MLCAKMDSPVGPLVIGEDGGTVCLLSFGAEIPEGARLGQSETLTLALSQLNEYFEGKRREFALPLSAKGTQFQEACWQALLRIPYGETRTYGDIAREIGRPKASRAVGGAVHNNPVGVVIPCHRVIGADGSLTGFGGGLPAKRALLALEGVSI